MALKAEDTRVVTIDGQARAVETLPEDAKQLVRFYDDWKQKELEARSTLLQVQTAMRALAAQIAQVVADADSKGEEVDGDEVVAEEAVADNAE